MMTNHSWNGCTIKQSAQQKSNHAIQIGRILKPFPEKNELSAIYPNPSKGEIFVKKVKSGSFELSDMTGRIVKKNSFSDNKIITDASSGTYLLKVMSEDYKINFVTKLIIR